MGRPKPGREVGAACTTLLRPQLPSMPRRCSGSTVRTPASSKSCTNEAYISLPNPKLEPDSDLFLPSGLRSVQLAINPQVPDPNTTDSFQIGRVLNIRGEPLVAPWLDFGNRSHYYGCVNNPAYKEIAFARLAELVRAGASSIQHDDPTANYEAPPSPLETLGTLAENLQAAAAAACCCREYREFSPAKLGRQPSGTGGIPKNQVVTAQFVWLASPVNSLPR